MHINSLQTMVTVSQSQINQPQKSIIIEAIRSNVFNFKTKRQSVVLVNLQNSISIKTNYKKCQICHQEDFKEQQMVGVTICSHKFCLQCAHMHLICSIKIFKQIKCPIEDCNSPVNKESPVYDKLSQQYKKLYKKYESFCKSDNFRFCPISDCQGKYDINAIQYVCNVCKNKICKNCNVKQHKGQCINLHIKLVAQFCKKCPNPKCQALIQKVDGCNHISCKCGTEFCYLCGQIWKGHICKKSISLTDKSMNEWMISFICRIGLIIWLILGGLCLLMIGLLWAIEFMIQSIFCGSIQHYKKTLQKNEKGCLDYFGLILVIPLLIYGIYQYLRLQKQKKWEYIKLFYYSFIEKCNLLLQK